MTPRPDARGGAARVVVALGDPNREQRLLVALQRDEALALVERCLSAEQLLARLRTGGVDAALVAHDLHRLGEDGLAELAATGVPLVLLAPTADADPWCGAAAVALPVDADGETVRAALRAAVRGERAAPPTAAPSLAAPPAADPAAPTALGVLAVASGHGSPGRTTVAVGLAAALGAVAPTILVDLDLAGPSVAAGLDADPTRNLYMLAHAEPGSVREWDRALAQETQPLGPRSPRAAVLCGVPKPEMRAGISRRFVERLVAELRARYRYVVLDVGAELLAGDLAVHRTALALADQALLVAAPDLVGLWHARVALGLLEQHVGVPAARAALVVNRHDRRHHHGRAEIEWALGVGAAALVPHDHRAAQRALLAQRPLVYETRSAAARAILDLAGRVHGGTVRLPEPGPARRLPGPLARLWPLGRHAANGVPHGDRLPAG